MKQFGIQFIISNSVIVMLAIIAFFSSPVMFAMFFVPVLLICIVTNATFSGIIYYINHKVSIFLSVFIFVLCAWFLKVINRNSNDYSDYENWQFYNHQQIISTKLDLIIGRNLLGFQLFLFMILLNLFSGFIVFLINYFRNRKNRELDFVEED
ncbi:hypothetical protein [Flavobacterium azizsancarii]|uniref:hypothetical protein n=1 Tax=Flavobacterium azizsancarii TaxID=2961580 RepID=UPI0023003620|nr:hypothetical protein [Flavobacterium azizsancarii]